MAGTGTNIPCAMGCRGSKKPSPNDLTITFKHLASGQTARFAAFITDFSDTYTARWNQENVFGRMDPISNYQGTGRVISVSWKVLSLDECNANCNMGEVSKFLSFMYPAMSAGQTGDLIAKTDLITTPPVMTMRFANWAQDVTLKDGVFGYINGPVSYKPNLEAGVIYPRDGSGNVFAKEIMLSCEFVVLHTHKLGWNPGTGKPNTSNFPYNVKSKRNCKTPSQQQGSMWDTLREKFKNKGRGKSQTPDSPDDTDSPIAKKRQELTGPV